MIGRKLRYGMIGGGRGAFIGAVHRIAAQLDGQAELVAGAFSSDPQRSRDSAADLFVAAGAKGTEAINFRSSARQLVRTPLRDSASTA